MKLNNEWGVYVGYQSKSMKLRLLNVLNDIISGKTFNSGVGLTLSQSLLLKAVTGNMNIDSYNNEELCKICLLLLEQINNNVNALYTLSDKDYRTCSIFGDDVLIKLDNQMLGNSICTFLIRDLELLILSKNDYNEYTKDRTVAQKLVELDKNSVINILYSISETNKIETPYRTYNEVSNIIDFISVTHDDDFIIFLSDNVVFMYFRDINGGATGMKVFLKERKIVGNVSCADDKSEVTLDELSGYIDMTYEG